MILSLATIGGISFILALSGVLTPGPLLTVIIKDSMKKGFIAGPLIILGHGILELVLVMAIVNGLGEFLKKELITSIVSILGGGVLLWMGRKMLEENKGVQSFLQGGSLRDFEIKIFPLIWSGMILSLSNPYWSLWWATVGLSYMVNALELGLIGLIAFFVGHISADFLWFSLVSFGVSSGRGILKPRIYHWIIFGCAIFLFLFGIWFLITGLRYLFKISF